MEPLQELLAREQIRELKARYFRTMDTKDWVGYGDCFAPDCVVDMRSENHDNPDADPEHGLVRGNRAYASFVRSHIDAVHTVHHGHMGEIAFTSASTAHGIWAMEDKLWWPAENGQPGRHLHGYGHYHETYVYLDGQWLIQTMKLTRLRVDIR
ncbi:MAG: nuclear transport factor 2 family protein [Proteobacteria bacterium]|nr:nuclear transport factor 2 family protein [Pseudomonadota bacterium]HQR03850.1 nuclear transport factor 2 family protein [Rhodocyclaceae bacterium]